MATLDSAPLECGLPELQWSRFVCAVVSFVCSPSLPVYWTWSPAAPADWLRAPLAASLSVRASQALSVFWKLSVVKFLSLLRPVRAKLFFVKCFSGDLTWRCSSVAFKTGKSDSMLPAGCNSRPPVRQATCGVLYFGIQRLGCCSLLLVCLRSPFFFFQSIYISNLTTHSASRRGSFSFQRCLKVKVKIVGRYRASTWDTQSL